MKDYYSVVKEEVNAQLCNKHYMRPSMEIIDGKVVLDCCCNELRFKCYQVIIDLLNEFKAQQLEA